MASKYMTAVQKGIGKRSLDVPVAAFAALSLGFVTFSLPADLLEELVGATGLSSFLAAAQPPLGNTARIALSLASAGAAFAFVYFVLRLLDRKPRPPFVPEIDEEAAPRRRKIVEAAEEEPEELDAPRLRRWDRHPDAPARRPIFASADLGEPEAPKSPLVAKGNAGPKPAQPFWEPDYFPAADPEEAEAWLAAQEDEQPLELPEQAAEPEPEPEPQPKVQAAQPSPEPVVSQPFAREPISPNESIAELMARLERGLSRREDRSDNSPSTPANPPTERDERLKSAIDNLQRIAARGL